MKRYLKTRNKKLIAKALEMLVGQNMSPAEVSRELKKCMPAVCGWMTNYWFYKKPKNPIVLILKSNV